jgi:hypothetical protein
MASREASTIQSNSGSWPMKSLAIPMRAPASAFGSRAFV